MCIFQKGNNWYIDYYVKGRRKRRKIGHSKKLAQQALKNVQTKVARGEYLGVYDEKKIPFDEYAEQYLDYSKANKAWTTYKRDKISTDHLKAFFKNKYLFEIQPDMIEKYKNKRLEKVGPAAVNRELACLKHMFTKAAVTRAGIKNFRFHDLRHTFGSHLVMQGIDLRTVQQIMGHKEIKMTMRYAHLSPEYVQKAVEKLDSLWTLYGHQSKDGESDKSVSY